jgi:hypothetical protein
MSPKLDIQNQLQAALKTTEFPAVEYDTEGQASYIDGELDKPSSVVVNEQDASLQDRPEYSARARQYVHRDWQFLCIVKFDREVDTFTFLTEGLNGITVSVTGYSVQLAPGRYTVNHSVRQGAHNGTQFELVVTAQMRR